MTIFSHRITEQIPSLRRYARALTGGNMENADDLVQDTLERAYAKWSLFRLGAELRPWLFSIMHNVFVNDVRRMRNGVPICPIDEAVAIGTPATQENQVQVREVLAAVGRLAPEFREVLVLVSIEAFSYAETAKILGIPMGTVMSRLFRARTQLRTLTGEPSLSDARPGLRLVQ
jgi:RNA polymerase sigma-70 factor (ECF subfamily)